ncbi:MAG: hypothetical protein QOC62_5757, partial [Mycobacterium sp.]|nr:hypothetical protein [Mycobacterium sp.]
RRARTLLTLNTLLEVPFERKRYELVAGSTSW